MEEPIGAEAELWITHKPILADLGLQQRLIAV
jgi:hypothetical protein